MSFEEAYKRLNEISALMDSKDVPLEEAVALYSEAAKLVDICGKQIEAAKLEIKKINDTEASAL